MSSQYDTIQRPYDEIRKSSIAIIEKENVRAAIEPLIKGARVLDLACGSGFYSLDFMKWGASRVVGIDISPVMLTEAARQAAAELDPNSTKQISFVEADCSRPSLYDGGPFDVVFAAWLLNYAGSGSDMCQMFQNIALNLKDDGHFLGVTPVPSEDPVAFYAAESKARPEGSGFLVVEPTGRVHDGIVIHVHGDTSVGPVDFDNYHLRSEVYEAAAREGGLHGNLGWRLTTVPEGFLEHRDGGASIEELESYAQTANYGILVISKQSQRT
ncbi:hypothetical protein N0V82_009092 [Gnomoniopsis sp. IMI 355080]|nr:hypothetical protein N0V82_009092 [Gnomoniopsis sp. IMI 355080]